MAKTLPHSSFSSRRNTGSEHQLFALSLTVRIWKGFVREYRKIRKPPSHFGYSGGHWNEATLVIETPRIDWPYFYIYGTPQSEAVHVTERYTPSDDQSRLDVHITVTDPEIFTQPATFEIE